MPDPSPDPVELSAADLRFLRWLAVAWGAIIATTWFVLDDARSQLVTTAAQLGSLAATLFSLYLLRRWRRRQ